MKKEQQKGVSLIITFFILTIILAVVLAISIILYSEIKIIKTIGSSVVAFYAADSGIEKILYYDRKVLTRTGTGIDEASVKRGFCNMCDTCHVGNGVDIDTSTDTACLSCSHSADCDPLDCTSCQITFYSLIDSERRYDITAVLTTEEDNTSNLNIDSYGRYKDVKRAVNIVTKKEEAPDGIVTKVELKKIEPASIFNNPVTDCFDEISNTWISGSFYEVRRVKDKINIEAILQRGDDSSPINGQLIYFVDGTVGVNIGSDTTKDTTGGSGVAKITGYSFDADELLGVHTIRMIFEGGTDASSGRKLFSSTGIANMCVTEN